MDPSPLPSPLAFFPPIPGPNPSFSSNNGPNQSLPANPQPPSSAVAAPYLSTTLSDLKALIALSQQTLASLSTLLPHELQNAGHVDAVTCPYNPHHRMPPESLFSHYIHCPTSLELSPAVESLNYRKTLVSSDELAKESPLVQTPTDPGAEMCFTLDDYTDFRESLNFFYKDCPGVVSFPNEDDSIERTFTLPGCLSIECANFVADISAEVEAVDEFRVQLLPSEYWSVQNEVRGWNDYPSSCTYYVVRALSSLGMVKVSDLRRWIIVHSPRFGIVLDVAMRDHLAVLLILCLKAIVKESRSLVKLRSSTKFDCPIFVQAMAWLASQLSVLYGEMSGKFFVIDLLKKCILDVASRLLFHSSDLDVAESSGEHVSSGVKDLDITASDAGVGDHMEPVQDEGRGDSLIREGVCSRVIFVSQVLAAVAALHERSVLEQKIRALRQSQQLPSYQRVMEHYDLSKRAEVERKKRPDYRPIPEHDGLPRQQLSMQDSGKTKTREELLAEERDYKRRRTSYRGKKSNRNPSEVLRDIIGEYMEEIKQAGGIGCFEKAPDNGIPLHGPASPSDHKRKNRYEFSGASHADSNATGAYVEHGSGANRFDDAYSKYEPLRKYPKHADDDQKRVKGRDRLGKDHYSQSPERRSYGRSSDGNSHRDRMELHKTKHQDFKRSSFRSNNQGYESSSRNYVKEDDKKSRSRDRTKRDRNDRYSLDFENSFSDRYDPSNSSDIYEDETA